MRSEKNNEGWLLTLPASVATHVYQAVEALESAILGDRFAVGFASCNHGAGTSGIAWQFAAALAASGRDPVCLVEANVRTPRLADALGLRSAPGLAELMRGQANLDAVIQQPADRNVSVIVAGSAVPEGPPMLVRSAVETAMNRVRERFPSVVVDAAPVLPYPDTVTLARLLDGTVLVLRAERDRREVAQQAARVLTDAGARILGAVLNRKPLHIPPWLYRLL